MKVIQAPTEFERDGSDYVFMAGGISNCEPWQDEYIRLAKKKCQAFNDVVFLNPRRDDFDTTKVDESKSQILWEQLALHNADLVTFWFCKDTACPITLFELGCQLTLGDREVIVGIDPAYSRRLDLELQIPYYGYSTTIVYSVEDLVNKVEDYYVKENEFRRRKTDEYAQLMKDLLKNEHN